jgi:hypothetical protein
LRSFTPASHIAVTMRVFSTWLVVALMAVAALLPPATAQINPIDDDDDTFDQYDEENSEQELKQFPTFINDDEHIDRVPGEEFKLVCEVRNRFILFTPPLTSNMT